MTTVITDYLSNDIILFVSLPVRLYVNHSGHIPACITCCDTQKIYLENYVQVLSQKRYAYLPEFYN